MLTIHCCCRGPAACCTAAAALEDVWEGQGNRQGLRHNAAVPHTANPCAHAHSRFLLSREPTHMASETCRGISAQRKIANGRTPCRSCWVYRCPYPLETALRPEPPQPLGSSEDGSPFERPLALSTRPPSPPRLHRHTSDDHMPGCHTSQGTADVDYTFARINAQFSADS